MAGDHGQKRQVNFWMDAKVYANLKKRAEGMGMATGTYARLLFDAAYAARVGREKGNPTTDRELDQAVRAVFCMAGEFSVADVARTLGVSEDFVRRVVKAGRRVAKERAA